MSEEPTPRAWIDGAMCIGSGTCVRITEGAIELDDDGVAHVVDLSRTDAEKLLLAEQSCPTGAVFLETDD